MTLTKNQAIAVLADHGYSVTGVKGCRKRTGTGYQINGNGYYHVVNLGRLRQMAQNLLEGRAIDAVPSL